MDKYDHLKALLKAVDHRIAKETLESHVKYLLTSECVLLDKPLVYAKYNAQNLEVLLPNLKMSALDDDARVILDCLRAFKESILAAQADYILIYKGGFNTLRLENDEKPDSGRSIFIEINSLRHALLRHQLQTTSIAQIRIPWLVPYLRSKITPLLPLP